MSDKQQELILADLLEVYKVHHKDRDAYEKGAQEVAAKHEMNPWDAAKFMEFAMGTWEKAKCPEVTAFRIKMEDKFVEAYIKSNGVRETFEAYAHKILELTEEMGQTPEFCFQQMMDHFYELAKNLEEKAFADLYRLNFGLEKQYNDSIQRLASSDLGMRKEVFVPLAEHYFQRKKQKKV